jgi:hypothetical protein
MALDEPIIVVLGPLGGGTSALASVLRHLGVFMGVGSTRVVANCTKPGRMRISVCGGTPDAGRYLITDVTASGQRCSIPHDWTKPAVCAATTPIRSPSSGDARLPPGPRPPASAKCCASPQPESGRFLDLVFFVGMLNIGRCPHRLIRFQRRTQGASDHRQRGSQPS